MIRINLNPYKRKKIPSLKVPTLGFSGFSIKNERILFILVPLFIIGGTFIYYFYLTREIDSLQEEKIRLTMELEKDKEVKNKIESLKRELAERENISEKLNLKIKIYEYLSSGKDLAVEMLKVSLNYIPDGLWLENAKFSLERGNIVGYALQPDFISKYHSYLNRYYDVGFTATESKISSNNNLRYYSFNFEVKNFKQEKRGR